MNINLNLYKSFYYVAKYGGFTKASNYALISQSSLSANVKKLEEELGVVLFNRNGNAFGLTRAGKELYSKLEDILVILQDKAYNKKEIRIGCIRFVADNYLEGSIVNFLNNNKDVKLNVEILDSNDLFYKLKKDELDLVISRYPFFYNLDESIKIDKIFEARNVFVCSYEYYQKEMYNMKNDSYIYSLILPTSSEKRRNIEQYLVDNNIKYKIVMEVANSNLLKGLIKNNFGIVYINREFVGREVNDKEFVVLEEFQGLPMDNICVLYNYKKVDLVTKKFIEVLKNSIIKTDS